MSQRRSLRASVRADMARLGLSETGALEHNPAGRAVRNSLGDYGVFGRCTGISKGSGERCLLPGGLDGRCPNHRSRHPATR